MTMSVVRNLPGVHCLSQTDVDETTSARNTAYYDLHIMGTTYHTNYLSVEQDGNMVDRLYAAVVKCRRR